MNAKNQILIKKRVAFFHPFFILLFFIIFNPSLSYSTYNFNPKLEKAYAEFLKLRVDNGNKLVAEALKEDPNNGVAIFMGNYGDIISLFISEEKIAYDNLKKNEDDRIKKISKLNKANPYYLFLQAEIKIQWAFVKLKFGDEVSAVWGVRAAYKLLQENQKLYPDFVPTYKTLGLLNVLMGSIPEKYVSAANLIGMKGDINTGIEQLELVSESDTPYQFEAKIFQLLAENYILKKESIDFTSINTLYENNTDNLLVSFLYSSILLRNAKCDDALKILQTRPSTAEYISFPYLEFLTGEIYLYKGNYKQAREFYQKFLNNYKGKNFIKDAYYKIFLSFWLNNEEEASKPYINKILTSGQTLYDADKYAQKFAEKGEMPNKILMKSRLYFDGGYYQPALETINSFPIKESVNQKDNIEYYYRKARIFHQLNNDSNASLFYLKTIELSKNVNYYFAPNSCLQMGYIYKKQNNKELARIYFQKALSYKDYEYKNSIDNKAKAALNEMKKN